MKFCLFGWTIRDKPPYFNFQKTWVFIEKREYKTFDEKKIKEWVADVWEEFPEITRFKVIYYVTPFETRKRYYEITDEEDMVFEVD